jgi:hypothetical protein
LFGNTGRSPASFPWKGFVDDVRNLFILAETFQLKSRCASVVPVPGLVDETPPEKVVVPGCAIRVQAKKQPGEQSDHKTLRRTGRIFQGFPRMKGTNQSLAIHVSSIAKNSLESPARSRWPFHRGQTAFDARFPANGKETLAAWA